MKESTSTRIASIAAKGLRTGKLNEAEIRSVCASALTQKENFGSTSLLIEHVKECLDEWNNGSGWSPNKWMPILEGDLERILGK